MFKRIASVAILIILILSLTVGSTGYATAYDAAAYQTTTTVTVTDQPFYKFPAPGLPVEGVPVRTVMGFASGGFPANISDSEFGTMVVDMGSIRIARAAAAASGDGPIEGPFFTTDDTRMQPENFVRSKLIHRGLTGSVMFYKPGSETPDKVSVHWEANGYAEPGQMPRFLAHMQFDPEQMGLPKGSDMIMFQSSIVLNDSALISSGVISQESIYTNAIAAGEDNWHTVDVSSAIDTMNVDLNWEDDDSDLRLMVFAPDGTILGPYYDDSDGTIDGRINLNIANSEGLATGEWYLKVSDTDVTGTNDYYVKTY